MSMAARIAASIAKGTRSYKAGMHAQCCAASVQASGRERSPVAAMFRSAAKTGNVFAKTQASME